MLSVWSSIGVFTFWGVSAGALACLILSLSIFYELYWSPLSIYPGPKLWVLSRIPLQISVLRGRNHLDALALHARYGTVVRVGPNELSYITGQAFRDIYGNRPGGKFRRDPTHYLPPPNGIPHIVGACDPELHSRYRRMLAPAFSERALNDQEYLIQGYVDALIGKLRGEIGCVDPPRIDIRDWFNCTTFDIFGDLMFGESFDCLKESRLHPWIELLFNSIKTLAIAGAAMQFPVLQALLEAVIPNSAAEKAHEHFRLAVNKVNQRVETHILRSDFMSAILKSGLSDTKDNLHEEEQKMSRSELHSNAYILIIAGSETTATALSGCIYYLCTNPEKMSLLVKEIRSTFHEEFGITFRSSALLEYLVAVIEESLRLYPPFATTLSRITPKGGAMVDGQFVPEGSALTTMRHTTPPSNFALPDEFHPERWLGKDARFNEDRKDSFNPFSYGPQGCIGKKLAYCEIRLILCKLLWNFDISLCTESKNWLNQEVYFLWDKPPLMVTLLDRFEMKKGSHDGLR
ncbi:hypothetical protein N7532_010237 [Penicillium argentinense]|uniref:Uncharacterized protein n=1 Tax=Penicillium argentinense TaxID=1131581 RepID=A0A9W9EPI1_9EURO|nr:uncharacterized protein N7532_010237 [Penicillium argentinense]KAJ5085466.1 hypothetical protein N7532_010237 [Penicillium argentinense]